MKFVPCLSPLGSGKFAVHPDALLADLSEMRSIDMAHDAVSLASDEKKPIAVIIDGAKVVVAPGIKPGSSAFHWTRFRLAQATKDYRPKPKHPDVRALNT